MSDERWKDRRLSRRAFLHTTSRGVASLGLLASAAPWVEANEQSAANSRIGLGIIGFGVRGRQLLLAAQGLPGVEVVAICDVYEGRFRRAAEYVAPDSVEMTRGYQRVLERKDIDAVFVATPDHWHARMVIDAVEAGKDVYCEKPLAHTIEEGKSIVAAVKRTGRIFQVGSQHLSAIHLHEAKELIEEDRLGSITQVRAWWDTGSLIGAWVKPIPPDASPTTIDWQRFLGPAPHREFDPKRVFRWRCYRDYSEGLPGDVLSHLITEIHWLLGLNAPERVVATGGILHWKDEREVADTVHAACTYPGGQVVTLSTTQANGYNGTAIQFLGTKATLELTHRGWTLYEEKYAEGYSYVVEAWPREFREEFYREHNLPARPSPGPPEGRRTLQSFAWPSGYDSTQEHVKNFFRCVETRAQPLEDALVGHRAATVAHLINLSLEQGKTLVWDPVGESIVG